MDVVPSASNPSELFIYAVNHRKPADPKSAPVTGADSTIEIFKTTVGSTALTHLRTLRDPSDGESFFFTNDHATKTSFMRPLSLVGLESGSVGYCNVKSGCKHAFQKLHGANGIVRAPDNDTFYVANSIFGGITVFERQSDNALLKTHTIPTDRGLDNLSMDTDGVIWAPGFPFTMSILKHIADPSILSPVSAHSIALNTGPGSFYGEKFKVTKVFEDDGTLASGSTSVVHDRKRLFCTVSLRGFNHPECFHLHLGLASPHLTVCPM
ncbi:hypothetical protein B0H13DRAFT_1975435 [Mycena leptocephala]|nr:hypothetical protein B0H13DRAFT_1975435 [Mycena leptocephala]